MTILVRPLGYTGKLQELVWRGSPATVTAYVWGGGGGGGGSDSAPGGAGSGGGFAQGTFRVFDGDIIQVAVGGSGKAGAGRSGNAGGGAGGYSYTGSVDFYGGVGGASGPVGSSGAGGGGGGATVVVLNGVPIVIGGGGAGGGGGGNVGNAVGESAPGASGFPGSTTGGNGTNKTGDGGGGGGGGGGANGGQGGGVRSGDQGGLAGFYGTGLGEVTNNSNTSQPANRNSYYLGTPGVGGAPASPGTSGYASLEFNINGTFVKENGQFEPATSVLIKHNNVWNTVQSTWVKQDGIWKSVNGSFTPTFTNITGNFGGPGTTCISVCDESSPSWSSNRNSWAAFMSRRPGTPFYLLGPGTSSRDKLRVPAEFVPENLGYGPINVARDNGDPAKRSDWFAIANLASAPPGSVAELSIDNSGSMTINTVRASYNYFIEQCDTAGITVINRTMSQEKWVAPFL